MYSDFGVAGFSLVFQGNLLVNLMVYEGIQVHLRFLEDYLCLLLLTVLVINAVGSRIITKATIPMISFIGFEKASSEIRIYVKMAANAEENRIFPDETQSTDTPKRFLMKRKLMNKPGRLTVNEVTIKPITPKLDIKMKLNGKPMAAVRTDTFKLNFV